MATPSATGVTVSLTFHRQFGDGLTDIATVVHNLRDGESLTQKFMTMLNRAPADLGACKLVEA